MLRKNSRIGQEKHGPGAEAQDDYIAFAPDGLRALEFLHFAWMTFHWGNQMVTSGEALFYDIPTYIEIVYS